VSGPVGVVDEVFEREYGAVSGLVDDLYQAVYGADDGGLGVVDGGDEGDLGKVLVDVFSFVDSEGAEFVECVLYFGV